MQLRVAGQLNESRTEIDTRYPPRNNLATMQVGVKAARKREWPPRLNVTDSDFDAELSDNSEGKASSVESDKDPEELNKSGSDAQMPGTDEEEEEDKSSTDDDVVEIRQASRRSFSPLEIKFLASPPIIVKNLPQTPPLETPQLEQNLAEPSSEPSEQLISAVEALTLSAARMQKTKRLPFLLRNLRNGFLERCRSLRIPTRDSKKEISRAVTVRYEYTSITSDHAFETQMEHWLCPLCELHGIFHTREMLASHLVWDHDEVFSYWEKKTDTSGAWFLRVVIADIHVEEERPSERSTLDAPTTQDTSTPRLTIETPLAEASSTIFPFVTLSPSGAQPAAEQTASPISSKLKFQLPPAIPPPQSFAQPPSARGRSTTATSTTTVSTQKTPRPPRYPTPPPPSNPLGPAAQPPFLPAKSEYGGPDIYYSCRPRGGCLYDLLNTLPMEPFGVLAWDVLDREDEIYDSDNVKDEYKVMHALWARWIVLNRNTFIADYYKGTITFVDAYWRMIHRAAGWDALRYWLLLLLAERFINGHEVAKVLKHYEGLTGMEFWYD